MKVAVNTPTGNIGRGLSERLLNAGVELVLLARNPDKVKHLADRGATVHQGNLEDADFVVKATEGVDVLFWLTPTSYETEDLRAYQNTLGDIAAKAVTENRIARVVDLSSIGAHLTGGTGPIAGLGDVEKKLEKTGAKVTHLRPGFFMENYFMSAETIATQNSVFLPVRADVKMAMISTDDIAKAATDRILDKTWTGRSVIELVGPSEETFESAAQQIGSALGREISHVTTTFEETRKALIGTGLPEATADLLVEMYEAFNVGTVIPESPETARIASTTFRMFAEQTFTPVIKAMVNSQGANTG